MSVNRMLVPNFSVCAPLIHDRSLTKLCVVGSRPVVAVSASKSVINRKVFRLSVCRPIVASRRLVYP